MFMRLRNCFALKIIVFVLLSIGLPSCTSIPNLQNELVTQAKKEDSARTQLDAEFKKQCSNGREIYSVPANKIKPVVTCGSYIFDKTFLNEARYEDLAINLRAELIAQSDLYAAKKIKQKTFKVRVIKAWNTYNEQWLLRSQGEVNEATESNEKIEKVAKVGVAVVAIVALVAVAAAAANNGGGGNNYANSYSGNCPCPNSIDAAGNVCGKRSAYSRAGGASPYCPGYP